MMGVGQVEDDLGASGADAVEVGVDIGNEVVADLGLGAADLVRLHHEVVERGIPDGNQHHHAAAENQLGVADGAVVVTDEELLLEAERAAQPLDSGWHVAVTQRRNGGNCDVVGTDTHGLPIHCQGG